MGTVVVAIPPLVRVGSVFAATLGLSEVAAAAFLATSGAIAASSAFALPVATPPNAIVSGSGYLEQERTMRAGVVLDLLTIAVLTGLIWPLVRFVWPAVLRDGGSRRRADRPFAARYSSSPHDPPTRS